MEVVGGIKRKGFSINDVDVLVHTNKLPRSPKETEVWGQPLMQELRMRVDLLFVNKNREKIPVWDEYGEFIEGYTTPDYAIAMYSPSSPYHVRGKETDKVKYAYLPTWGWLNKDRVDRADKLKVEKSNLRYQNHRLLEILYKDPDNQLVKEKRRRIRISLDKVQKKIDALNIQTHSLSDIQKQRANVLEKWLETGNYPVGVKPKEVEMELGV